MDLHLSRTQTLTLYGVGTESQGRTDGRLLRTQGECEKIKLWIYWFQLCSSKLIRLTCDEESFDSLSTCLPNIQNEIIDKHNALRRSVSPTASNMLKMKWSEEAATNAQIWADKCTLSHSTSEYRKLNTSTCGENLFMSSHAATWSSGIQAWFNESSNFIYGVGAKTKGAIIEHYTQVVWFSSSLVGCAVSYCPDAYQKYYYVCQYCPGGNIKDKINVPYLRGPRCAACPNDCDNGLCTNSCMYQDIYSHCKSLVASVGCKPDITKDNCKAPCKCQNKIY
ncbi:cysteine-rich secretory protein 2-like [Sorex fumeus]|uniref:cysteine-rich secretory protein 2-like n=1 Tax=Sorex fumeus TaxID=62283 RepID=UPI0024AC9D1B|nr:cysteine-rich secretory protein 2-like [Sorex fumeus]